MIDEVQLAALKTGAKAPKSLEETMLEMPQEELRLLRDALDKVMPQQSLSNLNLEHELLDQFNKVKTLQSDVLNDDSFPLNQRAQLAGAVSSTLQQLIKMQLDLQMDEKMKLMEAVLVDCIKTLPEETKTEFFAEYERRAAKAGLV